MISVSHKCQTIVIVIGYTHKVIEKWKMYIYR